MASIACTPPLPAPDGAAGPRERARGALLGLAVGDALGAPAENLKPSEIRARWGRITGYVTEQPCGTDDTEYAIFSGLLLARHGSALTPAHVEAAWHQWIADRAEGPFRGAGFSERGTLENLRRGLAAPISAQHRHAWSDGLAMRAAPFGVFAAGRPAEAARLAAIDGSVSHEGEGIYGGQAVAAGVAAAMTGAPVPVVIAAALAVIPDDSWTARSLRRAVAVAHRGERAVRSAVVIGGYPWTDLAPEAVALAFGAYAAADGDFAQAVLTAVNMGRDADTTAAVAGALSGATHGITAIPPHWATPIGPARGRCLPSMAGHHVLDVAELLVPGEVGRWGAGATLPTSPPGTPLPAPPRNGTDALPAAHGGGPVTAPAGLHGGGPVATPAKLHEEGRPVTAPAKLHEAGAVAAPAKLHEERSGTAPAGLHEEEAVATPAKLHEERPVTAPAKLRGAETRTAAPGLPQEGTRAQAPAPAPPPEGLHGAETRAALPGPPPEGTEAAPRGSRGEETRPAPPELPLEEARSLPPELPPEGAPSAPPELPPGRAGAALPATPTPTTTPTGGTQGKRSPEAAVPALPGLPPEGSRAALPVPPPVAATPAPPGTQDEKTPAALTGPPAEHTPAPAPEAASPAPPGAHDEETRAVLPGPPSAQVPALSGEAVGAAVREVASGAGRGVGCRPAGPAPSLPAAPAPQPDESDAPAGRKVGRKGFRRPSPLVGAGNAGQQDSEGRS